MKNVAGEKFGCQLPNFTTSGVEEDENSKDDLDTILGSLESEFSPCLTALKGWWTYEICFKKHIIQYHRKGDGDLDSEPIALGSFSMSKHVSSGDNFITQMYENGSFCQPASMNRKSELRYRDFLAADSSSICPNIVCCFLSCYVQVEKKLLTACLLLADCFLTAC